jgi:AcrR family transcriptional regulator
MNETDLITPRGTDGVWPDTASLIIETALQFFSLHGYEGTSMRQIATAVGVKPASLYNHFAAKEDILWEIARRAQEELAEGQHRVFEEVEGTVDRLEAFVRMHVAFHAKKPRRADITNTQLRSLSADRWERVVAFRDVYERRLRSLLREGHREGVFAVPEARIASYAILEMGMGVAIWYRQDGPVSISRLCNLHAEIALRVVGVDIKTRKLLSPTI